MQIFLDINTGAGNYINVANCGTSSASYVSFWDVVGFPSLASFHNRRAIDSTSDLDTAIDRMHSDVQQFQALPVGDLKNYQAALSFLITWRNLCRLHPDARVNVPL
jgi:hypothetical protein